MTLRLEINNAARKLVLLLCAGGVAALLCVGIVNHFIKEVLADRRLTFSRDTLISATERYPSSARLHAAAACAELLESVRDLARAEAHARRAISLSPYNYAHRTLLASIVEASGRRAEAERELRAAVELAPTDADLRWQLANLLVRQRKLTESLEEFRFATRAKATLLPGTLDLVWRASGERMEAARAVAGEQPAAQLALARFLLDRSRIAAAVEVFNAVDRNARLASPETPAFVNALIAAHRLEDALAVWANLGGERSAAATATGRVSNGSFESDAIKTLTQFDWSISSSEYARVAVDESTGHSGSRSLRVDLLGRDTTRLEDEIKQLIVVRPGAHYRLECFAKTEALVTPEGPRVAVTDTVNNWLGASSPIASGTNDWQRIAIEFAAPKAAASSTGVFVTIKRKPRFSYDDPTRGTVWLDDFSIEERDSGIRIQGRGSSRGSVGRIPNPES